MTLFQSIRNGLIPARLTVDEVFALTEVRAALLPEVTIRLDALD